MFKSGSMYQMEENIDIIIDVFYIITFLFFCGVGGVFVCVW